MQLCMHTPLPVPRDREFSFLDEDDRARPGRSKSHSRAPWIVSVVSSSFEALLLS